MTYAPRKLWLALNDYKYIGPLAEKLKGYDIKVLDTFKISAIMAVEYDAQKYAELSQLEKLLMDIEIENKKAIKSIENVGAVTYPEKMKKQEKLKVTGLDEQEPKIIYPKE